MQTFTIVFCSVMISSIIWIVPLLLLGKHKMVEEVQDVEISEAIEYNYIKDSIAKDNFYNEVEAECAYSYDIDDVMVTVAAASKIAGKIVSKDFAFSIN